MKDRSKTKNQLIEELSSLRHMTSLQENTALEHSRLIESLKDSEAKYRNIFNNALEGFYQSTPDGRYLNVNPSFARMLGYDTPEDMMTNVINIGQQLYVNPQVRYEWQAMLCKEGFVKNYEAQLYKKDGSRAWISFSAHTVCDDDGNKFYEGMAEDITKRKQAEDKVRKLLRAVEQSSASIVITDAMGTIEYANPMFTEITGYPLHEAIGQNPRILKSGTTSADEYKNLWNRITSGGVWKGEFCNKKKNGELYWEAASIAPVFDDDGIITNYVAVKEDITSRKQMSEKIVEALELNRAMFLNAPIGILTYKRSGRCISANNAAALIVGTTVENLLKQDFHQIESWKQSGLYDAAVESLNKQVPVEIELNIFTSFGKERWLHVVCTHFWSAGELHLLVIINDITDLKKAEEAIKKSAQVTKKILDSVHTGIVIVDADTHKITAVNPAASRLLESTEDEIVGQTCHKYLCPAEAGACPVMNKGQHIDQSERILLTSTGKRIPILKSVSCIDLTGRSYLIESFMDITEMKLLQKELEHLAHTDPLTGANNRRYFIELAEKEMLRGRRYGTPISLAMIDIDHFKKVNDTYGHAVGDVVLKELVSIFRSQFRPFDIIGRLGGEEFAVMLVECGLENGFAVLDRLRKRVEESVMMAGNVRVHIQISVGLAESSLEDDNLESLLDRSDAALYRAKNMGRNRVEIDSMQDLR